MKIGNVHPSGKGMNGNVWMDECPSLTTNKGEGVKIGIDQGDWKARSESALADGYPRSRWNDVRTGQSERAKESCSRGGYNVDKVWYEKRKCYISIRRLTPKECFRLQGWTDDYFESAEMVNSDSQLYKQAGNGVTVNVVYEIGRRI